MAGGTPRWPGAAPARHIDRSYEGGRRVDMEVGAGRSKASSVDDAMRVEAGDLGYPGASSDMSVQEQIEETAEAIARMSPTFQENKRSVAAKLKAAIDNL